MSKRLCHCNYCGTYIEEPEVRGPGNLHARNVCPCSSCGKELDNRFTDFTVEMVTDSFYANTPKLRCHPNYLH